MRNRPVLNLIKALFWLVIAALASLVFIAFMNGENPFMIKYEEGDLRVLHQETLSEDISSIEIDWTSGGVDILKSPDDKIHVVERSTAELDESKWLKTTINDETLRITSRNRNVFFFFFWHTPQTFLEIRLPAKLYDQVKLDLPSGLNRIFELNATVVDIDATSGAQYFSNIHADSFKLKMTSGLAVLKDFDVEDLALTMTSGNLTFTGIASESFKAEMTSGIFNATLKDNAPSTFDFTMTSGQAELFVSADADFKLTLEKTSGSFNADFTNTSNGNTYTHKNGRDDYELSMTSGLLGFHVND